MLGGTYGQCGGVQSVQTHSQTKSEPTGVACTPFIEHLCEVCMRGIHTGADLNY